MIDVYNITNYQRSTAELEEFLLFTIIVAGKNADQQALKLEALLKEVSELSGAPSASPFAQLRRCYIKDPECIETLLRKHKIGQYYRIRKCLEELLKFVKDVRTVNLEMLESFFGIGPKTARFFLLHSRPNEQYAVLDTHILRFIKEELKLSGVPKSTPPSGPIYNRLELAFLNYCYSQKRSVAEIDLEIWKSQKKAVQGYVEGTQDGRTGDGK